jgi:hypothetical protein
VRASADVVYVVSDLCARAEDAYSGGLSYRWAVLAGNLDLGSSNVVLTSVDNPNLVLAESVMTSGQTYMFQLTVTGTTGSCMFPVVLAVRPTDTVLCDTQHMLRRT